MKKVHIILIILSLAIFVPIENSYASKQNFKDNTSNNTNNKYHEYKRKPCSGLYCARSRRSKARRKEYFAMKDRINKCKIVRNKYTKDCKELASYMKKHENSRMYRLSF